MCGFYPLGPRVRGGWHAGGVRFAGVPGLAQGASLICATPKLSGSGMFEEDA